jgi:N-methylhydantoinase B
MSSSARSTISRYSLDPVTFEVLRNALITTVDQMAEQILRTCHSFVIYCRDFSSAISDADGNTVAQGSQDIACHVGTLHFTSKAVLEYFGDDLHPGDVFAVNDPYLGGTHFSDVRLVRPVFADAELIAFTQANGHWADIGGSVPGSFDMTAREHFGEGVRIPPVRVVRRGEPLHDVIDLIVHNTRAPSDCLGDLNAQVAATAVGERELLRLAEKYGTATLTTAFAEVQDYVENITRHKLSELPDGRWETVDYIDFDPDGGEGLVPIRVAMEIKGDHVVYDLSGSHPAIGSFLNSAAGASFSGVIAGTKCFFPEIPLNSGFFRPVEVRLGDTESVVNAQWPTAVTGFCAGPFEKIMNSVFELWSSVVPDRAIACSFNLEYFLVGGRAAKRSGKPFFMWYDWMVGGWGGRRGMDGMTAGPPVFGVGLMLQPVEAQERLSPVLSLRHEIVPDSGGPGRDRGGLGTQKDVRILEIENCVVSYSCDRARSIAWGLEGGLPSGPHGVWLRSDSDPEFLGAAFSGVPLKDYDELYRPAAGGGGFGDPLDREPEKVIDDVIDGYVTPARALKDYGVAVIVRDEELGDYKLDEEATGAARNEIRAQRRGWLELDPHDVAARYRSGELDVFDVVRRYGVILHWGTGELFEQSTEQFRAMLSRRAVAHW